MIFYKTVNILTVFVAFLFVSNPVFCQNDPTFDYSKWTTLTPGMEYREVDAPIKSILGDSKICILRLDPKMFDYDIHMATRYDKKSRNPYDWADTFKLNVVFNASMYELGKPLTSRGFLKAGGHENNAVFRENYRSAIALNPKDTTLPKIQVIDFTCDSWSKKKNEYDGIAQGLRMITCDGAATAWNKRNQSCSMMIAANDKKGWFYIIFSRSPYTHNQMIRFMKEMPYGLTNAVYLEGGPETSLLIDVNGHCIEKVGSYVSDTYPSDKNVNFWRLPNVIGIKIKK
ncbi:MAG: hypothetical protein RL264_114 [Bacteroidota bacterium]|jgi:hypothetical protein